MIGGAPPLPDIGMGHVRGVGAGVEPAGGDVLAAEVGTGGS